MHWGILDWRQRRRAAWPMALCAAVAVGAFSGPVLADDDDDCDCPHKRAQRTRQMQRTQMDAPSRGDMAAVKWVAIGYDYDDDGIFDGYEYIESVDLEQARNRARARRGFDGGSDRSRMSGRNVRAVDGQITDLRTVKFVDMDEPHVLADVETYRGDIVKVCLGPRHKIAELNLIEGDDVSIRGKRVLINDRPVIMARSLETGGRSVFLASDDNFGDSMKRVRGEILNTFTTFHAEDDEMHLIAKVQLDDGQTTLVDLGAQRDMVNLDLAEGDRVTVLGKHKNIDGTRLLLARQLEAEGRTINIEQHNKFERNMRGERRGWDGPM